MSQLDTVPAVKTYLHERGSYQRLNNKNQTLARFVVGQKYKVGTGIILFTEGAQEKSFRYNYRYKEFLRYLLESFNEEELLAFQWIPVRVSRPDKLPEIICTEPCEGIGGCIELGCTCNSEKGVCE